jgi:hypothetical protein
MIRETTINKFQAALEDLEFKCRMGSKITNDDISRQHSISKTFLTEAKNLGVVEKIGRSKYTWTWGAPNRATARRLIKHINNRNAQRSQKKEVEKIQLLTDPDKLEGFAEFPKQEQSKPQWKKGQSGNPNGRPRKYRSVEEVSWFWGLYSRKISK